MTRVAVGVTCAAALVMAGWMAGRAQATEPAFEIVVDVSSGEKTEATIRCVKGCDLKWVERGLNANSTVMPAFSFGCTGSTCTSGRVGGWLKQ